MAKMNPYLNSYVSVFAHPKPSTIANIRGDSGNPLPNGDVSFYSIPTGGISIQAKVFRLPDQRLPDCSGFSVCTSMKTETSGGSGGGIGCEVIEVVV